MVQIQLPTEGLHSNRLELLLLLLQPFLLQIRFPGKGDWKHLSSSWEEAEHEQSFAASHFPGRNQVSTEGCGTWDNTMEMVSVNLQDKAGLYNIGTDMPLAV